VASTGGDYIYGVPSREPGVAATAGVLDSYRLVLGSRDVPLGVELALEGAQIACAWVMRGPASRHRAACDTQLSLSKRLSGAHKGDVRRIELPPDLGFETSDWLPAPEGNGGKQRLQRYRSLLSANLGRRDYQPLILFQVEVLRVRSARQEASS